MPPPIMKFHNQNRQCVVTPPRSEGSVSMGTEMLRFAQHDNTGFGRENSSSAPAVLVYSLDIPEFFSVI